MVIAHASLLVLIFPLLLFAQNLRGRLENQRHAEAGARRHHRHHQYTHEPSNHMGIQDASTNSSAASLKSNSLVDLPTLNSPIESGLSKIISPILTALSGPSDIRKQDHYQTRQEKLAELYYQNQKGERHQRMGGDYPYINANYPCIYGENAIGEPSPQSAFDGHKYACGITEIAGVPIVYSFGSNKRQDFEIGVLAIRPDSRVFVFEIDPAEMVPSHEHLPQIVYHNLGIKLMTIFISTFYPRPHWYLGLKDWAIPPWENSQLLSRLCRCWDTRM